jgi:hypothetical protein
MIFGSVGLATPSRFEELHDYYESSSTGGGSASWLRPNVEQMWKKDAVQARQARKGLLLGVLALSALDVALDSFLLADDLHSPTGNVPLDIIGIGIGVGVGVWGVVASQTESSTEQRLRLYERAVGRPIELTDVGLRLAPTPGGLTVGLGGRF